MARGWLSAVLPVIRQSARSAFVPPPSVPRPVVTTKPVLVDWRSTNFGKRTEQDLFALLRSGARPLSRRRKVVRRGLPAKSGTAKYARQAHRMYALTPETVTVTGSPVQQMNGLGFDFGFSQIASSAISTLANTAISVGGAFATSKINTDAMKKQIEAQTNAQMSLLQYQKASAPTASSDSVVPGVSNTMLLAGGALAVVALVMLRK